MGQQSSNIHDIVDSIKTICSDVHASSSIADEFLTITYDEFKEKLKDFNKLSNQCLDSTGNKLLFIIKKGTEEHLFWKVTIRIACVKVDPKTQKIHSFKLIDLRKFLQIYRTLKVQKEIADESKQHDLTVSTIYNNLEEIAGRSDEDVESATECCICLERKPDISLPCAHTYCVQCIEEWNEDHDTCPICREHLDGKDDAWVLSEVPKAEEISEDIKSLLLELTEDSPG
ncbi:RING finger protein 141-like [Atheta coriaria]|uniref:RING finger protein 141-like n=1 Tax=Dalotia coriaria TaxID=877792 RepID=UPI0031F3B970